MVLDLEDAAARHDEAGYSYESDSDHLSEKKALARYKRAKSLYPDAIVELQDFDCGHWSVRVYKTPSEKNEYLQRRYRSILSRLLSRLRLPKTD